MSTILAIVTGAPAWVWAVLALIIYLGMRALKPRSGTPARLSVVPGIFLASALGTLLLSSRLSDILLVWLASCLLGIGIGASWTMLLRIDIDRTRGIIWMPGTAFWLVTGLTMFGMRYAIEVYIAFNRNLAQEALWFALPYAVMGLGTGMSAGWWAALMTRYLRAAEA
ncbi:DUF6622 family protein [Microvirga terrestris]|uniref:DUF1453 domain-containing protein n=1 Tax=Microvirga terrestris TaxID=2791024 RepID=A0ABS0HVA0_9HYPH|nr:DUF6622 family protein [Microvirga terrestris]MBF9197442.1 hypothetical protein [Microvirga terrestris]